LSFFNHFSCSNITIHAKLSEASKENKKLLPLELISKLRYRNVCKHYRETKRAAEFRIETALTHFGALCLRFEQILGTRLRSHSVAILGYVSAVDCEWRTIWIADARRDGKRFVVHADGKLTAFLALDAAIRSGRELA
jgi:hypothetical protein